MKIVYTVLSALFGEIFNVLVKVLSRQDEVVPEVVPELDALPASVVGDSVDTTRFAGLFVDET